MNDTVDKTTIGKRAAHELKQFLTIAYKMISFFTVRNALRSYEFALVNTFLRPYISASLFSTRTD